MECFSGPTDHAYFTFVGRLWGGCGEGCGESCGEGCEESCGESCCVSNTVGGPIHYQIMHVCNYQYSNITRIHLEYPCILLYALICTDLTDKEKRCSATRPVLRLQIKPETLKRATQELNALHNAGRRSSMMDQRGSGVYGMYI